MKTQEEKDNPGLDKKANEPVFDIIKMPKGYKVGRFEAEENDSVSGEKDNSSNHQHHKKNKKIGAIIIVVGVVFIVFLAYLIFSYIVNPNFSLTSIFNFSNKNLTEQNNAPIDDILKEAPVNEVVSENEVENIASTSATSTEEITTTTEETGEIDSNLNNSIIDADSDGLSNDEELILGTDFSSQDSDGDTYNDLSEALNLYDPAGNKKLINNPNISKYDNKSFGYSVLYPTAWDKNILSDESSAIFSINTNSFIQILVEPNESKMDIGTWYTSRFFNVVSTSSIFKKSGFSGVYSDDGLALYLTDENKNNIYTILYSLPEGQPQRHKNLFQIIVNSFLAKL